MRRPPLAHLAGGLVVGALLLGIVVPWGTLLGRAVTGEGWEVLLAPRTLERLAFTTYQAALSTALTLLLGLPAAIALGTLRIPGASLLRALFTVPFVMPSIVAALAMLSLLGPRGLLGIDLRDTLAIIVLAHAAYNVGVVVRIVGAHLEALAPRLHEAAATLGASPLSRLRRVTLPLAAPAIVASATLVFLFCFTSFGVVVVLAPQPALATLEVEIYRALARRADVAEAAALATLQLVVVMALVVLYTRWQRRVARSLPRSAAPAPSPRGPLGIATAAAAIFLAVVATLAPLAALAALALDPPGFAGPTLAGFRSAGAATGTVGLTELGGALANSLSFGALATLLALLLGGAAAYAIVRGGWHALDALSLLPIALSAVTVGLGVLLAYPDLAAAPAAIPVAHALLALPFVARVLVGAWRALEGGALAAAATLGAGPWRTLLRVELPLLRPALLTAAGFAAAISLGDFGAALVLRRPETATLPVAIFERLGRPGALRYAEALALALLLLLLTALVVLLFEALARRRRGSAPGEL
jgi:thiamine transport system permease protein